MACCLVVQRPSSSLRQTTLTALPSLICCDWYYHPLRRVSEAGVAARVVSAAGRQGIERLRFEPIAQQRRSVWEGSPRKGRHALSLPSEQTRQQQTVLLQRFCSLSNNYSLCRLRAKKDTPPPLQQLPPPPCRPQPHLRLPSSHQTRLPAADARPPTRSARPPCRSPPSLSSPTRPPWVRSRRPTTPAAPRTRSGTYIIRIASRTRSAARARRRPSPTGRPPPTRTTSTANGSAQREWDGPRTTRTLMRSSTDA